MTVHAGETGEPTESRDGHGASSRTASATASSSADDPRVLAMLRERGTVLEVCPSSNLNTGVLRDLADIRRVVRAFRGHEVRFTISTDGPEMLRTYLRDEIQLLLRNEILSLEEVLAAIDVGATASFLDRAPVIASSVAGRGGTGNGHAAIPVEVGS